MSDILEMKVDITLKSDRAIRLNDWTGSTIRGALSHNLMRKRCISKDKKCEECSIKVCPVGVLFNTPKHNTKQILSNPIIVESFSNNEQTDTINIHLTLFGTGTMYLQNILMELEDGICIGNTRTVFYLESARYSETGEEIFKDGLLTKVRYTSPKKLDIEDSMKITLITPLYAKDSFISLEFEQFMRAVLLRVEAVYRTVGITDYIPRKELLDKASNIKVLNKRLYVKRMVRKSSNKGEMCINTINGTITYKAEDEFDFQQFLPYIAIAQEFYIGKMCTMGLGRFKVENEK